LQNIYIYYKMYIYCYAMETRFPKFTELIDIIGRQ